MRRARRPSQTSPQVDEYNDCYVPSQFTAVSDLALRHQLHNTRFPRLGLWWLVGGAGRLNVLYHETELDDSIMCGLAQPQHSKLAAWSTDPLGGVFINRWFHQDFTQHLVSGSTFLQLRCAELLGPTPCEQQLTIM